jgi:hypothetical protein
VRWQEVQAVVEIGPWLIDADAETTRHIYSQITRGSPEECACRDCRNFAASREIAYPQEAKRLLESLGIDWHKEAEIYHITRWGSSGLHAYAGWFHLVGVTLNGPPTEEIRHIEPYKLTQAFSLFPYSQLGLVRDVFRGFELVQLEFRTEAPWVLDEEYEGNTVD